MAFETSIGELFFHEYLNQRVVFYDQDYKQFSAISQLPDCPAKYITQKPEIWFREKCAKVYLSENGRVPLSVHLCTQNRI